MVMVKGSAWKVLKFSNNEFWKNIGCLISAPIFGFGGSRLWVKEESQNISGNKRKILSTRGNVDLHDICQSYIIYCLIFYITTILIPFPPVIFVASITLGEWISVSIGHKGLSLKSTRNHMNGVGKSC